MTSSSSIFYRFRSAVAFEELPLPGTAPVRLFDIKKAIVKKRNMDNRRVMDFDLSIEDAETDQELTDETTRVSRGTRLIVRRTPATKGQCLLDRIEREECQTMKRAGAVVPEGFYTIDDRKFADEDDEFVALPPPKRRKTPEVQTETQGVDEGKHEKLTDLQNQVGVPEASKEVTEEGKQEKGAEFRNKMSQQEVDELEALKAVTEGPDSFVEMSSKTQYSKHHAANHKFAGPRHMRYQNKPNADPELRKTATVPKERVPKGVPRRLQTSTGSIRADIASFNDLKRQTADTRTDFKTVLAVTGATIPEYLACAVCAGLVLDAMCLHWDPEGRSACEGCIREAVARDCRCPVTRIEGITPEDLHPNKPIRHAAVVFKKDVTSRAADICAVKPETESGSKSLALQPTEGSDEAQLVATPKATAAVAADADEDFGGDVFELIEESGGELSQDTIMVAKESTKVSRPSAATGQRGAPSSQPWTAVDQQSVPRKHGGVNQRKGHPAGYKMGPAIQQRLQHDRQDHRWRSGGVSSRRVGGRNDGRESRWTQARHSEQGVGVAPFNNQRGRKRSLYNQGHPPYEHRPPTMIWNSSRR